MNEDQIIISLGKKLDGLAKLLNLFPYNKKGKFEGKLKPVSHDEIKPVFMICPNTIVCQSLKCNPHSLHSIQEIEIYQKWIWSKAEIISRMSQYLQADVLVVGGTTYFVDHERFLDDNINWNRLYLNSAKYLKVGRNTWVDWEFSNSVLNGIYKFHASAAAYTKYWNNSFGTTQVKVTWHQV